MTGKQIWVVRAGRGAAYAEDFVSNSLVAIGWSQLGELPAEVTKEDLLERLARAFPEEKEGSRGVWASVIYRFLNEIAVGDEVATYDRDQRLYYLGFIKGGVEAIDHEVLPRARRVDWQQVVRRDDLKVSTRNSLGSIGTLFSLNSEASEDLRKNAFAIGEERPPKGGGEQGEDEDGDGDDGLLKDVLARADEFIEDRIARLDWSDMQELVAGLLRAMGYRTKVSEAGPDRGVDIFASPDGLGLEEPRIFVEVKHRTGTAMGAQAIRAFLGGRKPGDRCFYVSTGGFTKDARYEAERSSVPLMLVGLPELRELVVEHYENLDASTTALVPLKRLYWPTD